MKQPHTVILTALAIENAAVVAALGGCTAYPWNGTTLHTTNVSGHAVLVAPASGVGPERAAQATQRAIDVWGPARLLLVGIAAGIPEGADDLRLGDVLVPNQVVGYDPAKLKPTAVERRWEVFRPDRLLLDRATGVRADEWVHTIGVPRPDGSDGRVIPRVHVGPVLSGSKVVADTDAVARLRASWPKMISIEMESIGVALTAYRNGAGFLVVKAASDFADSGKADDWHPYAAAAAARFAAAVLRQSPAADDRPASIVPARVGTSFPSAAKLHFCRHLGPSWKELTVLLAVPAYQEAQFAHGDEAREVWHWLESRDKLHALPGALRNIGRPDLADALARDDRDAP